MNRHFNNRKGFTLVELLVTIAITALVIGISTFGIIKAIDSSKEKAKNISISNIKKAANIYSSEAPFNAWKDISTSGVWNENLKKYKYFCVTIRELINKGMLKEDEALNPDYGLKEDNYIAVKKDIVTQTIVGEEIVSTSELNDVCNGTVRNERIDGEIKLGEAENYTDRVIFDVNFDISTDSPFKEKVCTYREDSYSDWKEEEIPLSSNKCVISGLTSSSSYDVKACVTTENGSKVCSNETEEDTKAIKKPTIVAESDSAKITFYSDNIYGGKGNYYFRSSKRTTSNVRAASCGKVNTGSCLGSTTDIQEGIWYKTSNTSVSLTFSDVGEVTIDAETRDESSNSASSNKKFMIYGATFYRNGAVMIGGKTSDSVSLRCLADVGKTCQITSPSITRAGYDIIGYDTNQNSSKSTWNHNASKYIGNNVNYYAITKKDIEITFDDNNSLGNATKKSCSIYNDNTTCSIVSPSLSYSGYEHLGWGEVQGSNEVTWEKGASKDVSNSGTYYAIYNNHIVHIRYNVNGGSISGGKYTQGSDGNAYENDKPLETIINYNDKLGENGLLNYNNSSYLNIVRTGYKASSQNEWKCLSGCTSNGKTFDQSKQYDAKDFCDASKGDCTVILGVNWTNNQVHIRYNVNGGKISGGKFTEGNDGNAYESGKVFETVVNYNDKLGENGLLNYNNSSYLNIVLTDYKAKSQDEWLCLAGCTSSGKTFDQSKQYNASEFCDASSKDCTVTLGVNWDEKLINGNRYSCYTDSGVKNWDSGTRLAVYNITSCTDGKCNYSRINGLNSSYNLNNDVTKPNWEIAEGNLREGYSKCEKARNTYCVDATDGLNCRAGASSNSSVISYVSNNKYVDVYKTTMKVDNSGNNWYYYPYGNCYLSGSYLKTYCNSGGSTGGGSTGGGSTGGGSTEEDCPTKCSRANYPYTKPYNGTCYCCINADDVPLEQGRFNSNCIQP